MSQSASPQDAVQLEAYQTGSEIYTHIIELQGQLATFANFFLVITGAIWVAVKSNTFELPAGVSVGILTVHMIGSLAALQVVAANMHAILLRFEFLGEFGEKYYPDLEKIGQRSFTAVYGSTKSLRARIARWGRQRLLWYMIPLASFLGSLYLVYDRVRLGP